MTVIQVRGTSGSGKSTVIRSVMEKLGSWESSYVKKRRKPLYYRQNNLLVLGHYESQCGGCDTIGSARAVYNLIQGFDPLESILCEGLLLSEDSKWTTLLADEDDVRIVYLTTPLETCLERIRERRRKADNNKPLNTNNTSNRVRIIDRSRVKLLGAGVVCRRAPCKQAPEIILRWLEK